MKTKLIKALILMLLVSVVFFAVSCGEKRQGENSEGESVLGSDKGSQGLEYELSEDGAYYTVVGIGDCTDTDLIIPAIYNSLPVRAIGDIAFAYCSSLTSIVIPNSVTKIGYGAFFNTAYYNDKANWKNDVLYIGNHLIKVNSISGEYAMRDGTIAIGDEAFAYCSSLTRVIVPNSVITIGDRAFAGCERLTDIEISNSVTTIGEFAFYDCSSLTSVVIPDSVTTIGSSAFAFCDSLTNVVIGDGVTTIGNQAFYNTAYYKDETNWENDALYIDKHLIEVKESIIGEYTIKNGVLTIADDAFDYCRSLISIIIPDSVLSIGKFVFFGCDSLTSVVIGGGVTRIGGAPFANCASLTYINVVENNTAYTDVDGNLYNIDCSTLVQYAVNKKDREFIIPDSVTTIDHYAFLGCQSLISIVIPSSVTTIGVEAFAYCSSLTSIVIPNSVTTIGDSAFSNTAYYNDESNWENDVLYIDKHLIEVKESIDGEYTVKEGTLTIADGAFVWCLSLTRVEIPNSVTTIGESAFRNCSSLTSVVIGDSVTTIGDRAFTGCESLTDIEIPNSVTTIGASAFKDCESLTSIKYRGSVAQWRLISKGMLWDRYYNDWDYYKINCTITFDYQG